MEPLEQRRVLSSVWYVNDDAGGANTGADWANAYTDLQSALGSATAGDEIWVAAGTYKPTDSTNRGASFWMKSGVDLYGGFAGSEISRAQRDWVTNVTTLSGDIGIAGSVHDNSYHVVYAAGVSDATLDGFVVTAGNANKYNWMATDSVGGGMFNYRSSPTVTNVIFHENRGNDYVPSGGGGGMANWYYSSPTLTNVIFSDNGGDYGGAMHNFQYSAPSMSNVTFHGNWARIGGGIYNFMVFPSEPTLTNGILWGNTARSRGPQIYNDSTGGNISVSHSIVQGGWGGVGNLSADPLFVDAAAGDLHLKDGSPAIDTGTATGAPPADLDGKPRPVDGDSDGTPAYDMGAYEFVPSVPLELHDLEVTSPIDENGVAELSGAIQAPATVDNFTLGIHWGDPLSPPLEQSIELGTDPIDTGGVTWDPVTRAFTVEHQYLDDNPSGTAVDDYTVTLSLTDDDGGTATVLPPDPYSLWSGEGNAEDSINGNHGTVIGATFAPGRDGEAFRFDGIDDRVDMGNPPSLNFGPDEPFSLAAWFHWDGGGSHINNIIRKTSFQPDGKGYWLRIYNPDDTLRFFVGDGYAGHINPYGIVVTPVTPNEWHHVVGVRDSAGLLSLYLDGELKGTDSAPGADATGSYGNFQLGAVWDPYNEFFSGLIDEAAVYHQALTAEEVQALYHGSGGPAEVTVTVENVPPELADVTITSPIAENEVATLRGQVVDPGTLDTFTLDISWGDPLSPGDEQTIELGHEPIDTGGVTWDPLTRAFRVEHQYLDDNPSGTAANTYEITLAVRDDDMHPEWWIESFFDVTVENVPPEFEAGPDETLLPPDAGEFQRLDIPFTDPGMLDEWSGTVDWGDGSDPELLPIDPGEQTLDLYYVYTASDLYTVTVTLEDDDLGRWVDRFQVEVILTAQDQIARTGEQINALVQEGLLRENDAGPLLVSLEHALNKLDQQHTNPAVNNLEAAQHKVQALINSGRLPGETGRLLISELQAAIDWALLASESAQEGFFAELADGDLLLDDQLLGELAADVELNGKPKLAPRKER